jgi:hypothetical protein
MRPTSPVVSLFAALAILSTIVGGAATVSAQTSEFVNIHATAFQLFGSTDYLSSAGVLVGNPTDVARAPVQFTRSGLQICRLSMWVHDFEPGDVTVNLIRKRLAPDGSPFGAAPETIASVSSSGAVDALRRISTVTVTERLISASFFYWVELVFDDGPIEVSGVRIDTATSC